MCIFQYSEKPIMSIENFREGRDDFIACDMSSFLVTTVCTEKNTVS